MEFVLRSNPWADPNASISLEGGRDEAARRASTPTAVDESAQANARAAVLTSLQPFVGRQVTIQAWDPIMVILDEEGPFLISATIAELLVPGTDDGATPVLRLQGARSHNANDGYDLLAELDREDEDVLFPVSRLYWIEG